MRVPCLFVPSILRAACHEGGQPAAPVGIQGRVSLARAASCASLTRSVQDTAVRQMRSQMDAWKDASAAATPAVAAGGATPQASGPPASYSTTNTQVAGVDEADFVKNDGTRIFVLSGRNLFTATSWPPQDLAFAGKLAIEGWPSTMFLEGDQVVVFSSTWTVPPGDRAGPPGMAGAGVT